MFLSCNLGSSPLPDLSLQSSVRRRARAGCLLFTMEVSASRIADGTRRTFDPLSGTCARAVAHVNAALAVKCRGIADCQTVIVELVRNIMAQSATSTVAPAAGLGAEGPTSSSHDEAGSIASLHCLAVLSHSRCAMCADEAWQISVSSAVFDVGNAPWRRVRQPVECVFSPVHIIS